MLSYIGSLEKTYKKGSDLVMILPAQTFKIVEGNQKYTPLHYEMQLVGKFAVPKAVHPDQFAVFYGTDKCLWSHRIDESVSAAYFTNKRKHMEPKAESEDGMFADLLADKRKQAEVDAEEEEEEEEAEGEAEQTEEEDEVVVLEQAETPPSKKKARAAAAQAKDSDDEEIRALHKELKELKRKMEIEKDLKEKAKLKKMDKFKAAKKAQMEAEKEALKSELMSAKNVYLAFKKERRQDAAAIFRRAIADSDNEEGQLEQTVDEPEVEVKEEAAAAVATPKRRKPAAKPRASTPLSPTKRVRRPAKKLRLSEE